MHQCRGLNYHQQHTSGLPISKKKKLFYILILTNRTSVLAKIKHKLANFISVSFQTLNFKVGKPTEWQKISRFQECTFSPNRTGTVDFMTTLTNNDQLLTDCM